MAKKILITTLIILATLLTYSVFGANNIGDAARDMGNEMSDSWDKMGNTAENMGNNIQGAMNSVGNFMGMNDDNTDNTTDDFNNINNVTANNTDNYNTTDDANTAGYTATRTAADGTTPGLFGMNNNMWTWVILAVLGIAIVGLVWYYGAQTTERNHTK